MTNLYEVCATTKLTSAPAYQRWGLYIVQANAVADIKRYLSWYKEFVITQLWLVGDGCRYSGFPQLFTESSSIKVLKKTIIHDASVPPDKLETLDYIKRRLAEVNEPKPKRILELSDVITKNI